MKPTIDVAGASRRWLIAASTACMPLLALAEGVLAAAATACGPLPEPGSASSYTHRDSVVEANARAKSSEWRAAHYPAMDPDGPFARPKLADSADTNDAIAYYRLGDSVKWIQQGLADRAFYWSTRLDPTLADGYYARWDLRRHGLVYRLYPGDSVHRADFHSTNEVAKLDSLLQSAIAYNPFMDAALDIPPQISRLTERQANRNAATAGAWAYLRGDYRKAVSKWGEAIRDEPSESGLHLPRSYAWVHLDENDSAVADITALINRIQRIQDSTVAPYISKAFLYYAVGILRGRQQRYADARSAYESALLENLGFYMAHVRLSAVALLLQDTTTALNELETATLMRTDDPVLLTLRGNILVGAGRLDEAERELRAALRADSDYALPRAFLGQAAEQRHDTAAARSAYRDYLAHASRSASERGWVEVHLAHLTAPSTPDQ